MSLGESLFIPRGFRASGVTAGLKESGTPDLAVLASDHLCAAAGAFTLNRECAAPVKWCRERLPADDIRAVVINSGNANAATGEQGLSNARRTAAAAADLLNCRAEQVLVASTGVIGHQLPMDRIEAGLGFSDTSGRRSAFLPGRRGGNHDDGHSAQDRIEEAIDRRQRGRASGPGERGRDDRPGHACCSVLPSTGARDTWASDLRGILIPAVDRSFNCISVEGHASTNDTVLLLSSTAATEPILRGDELAEFARMVQTASEELARVAGDGEQRISSRSTSLAAVRSRTPLDRAGRSPTTADKAAAATGSRPSRAGSYKRQLCWRRFPRRGPLALDQRRLGVRGWHARDVRPGRSIKFNKKQPQGAASPAAQVGQ